MYRDRALAIKVIDYALGEMMLGYDAQGIIFSKYFCSMPGPLSLT
jgi:hypothetical protein